MIDFEQDYILENDKVLLRALTVHDFDSLLEYSINEPEIWSFNFNGANGIDNLKQYIDTALKKRKEETDYPFIVIDKKDNKVIGSTRFYLINKENKTVELGFTWYGQKYQGSYVNKNCKFLLLEFAFEVLQLERVGFRANSLNIRSINAMKSIGCVEEGILRNFGKDAKGQRIDSIVFSIIRSEWFETVKHLLQRKIL